MINQMVDVNIVEAMESKKLFGPWFKRGLFRGDSWKPWKIFLKALFAIPMNAADLQTFQQFTGRTTAAVCQFNECFIVAGRRAGKTRISATIGTYLAAFRDYSSVLSPGEAAVVMLLAADKRQAGLLKNYIDAYFTEIPILARMVESRTQENIRLKNRVVIEVHVSSYRSTRGYTLAAVIADEIAFWPSDAESANPASETLIAVRPGLATIPGSLLLAISSPYSRRGPLYEAFRDHYGKNDSPVLVWRASSAAMNPTINPLVIEAARLRDSVSARTEYDAAFRTDLESLFSAEVIQQRIVHGRTELPPLGGVSYSAFVDPSGGVSDSMVLSVAHEERGTAILDLIREIVPPFSPEGATREFVAVLKRYRCSEITGDKYGAMWVSEAFERLGILYRPSERNRSQIYLEFLPMVMSGQCELLDNRRLANQLVNLERKVGRGADLVDHPPGQHDDVANCAAGALVRALSGGGTFGLLEHDRLVALDTPPVVPENPAFAFSKQGQLEMEAKMLGLRKVPGQGYYEKAPVITSSTCPQCHAAGCQTQVGGGGIRCGSCGCQYGQTQTEPIPTFGNLSDYEGKRGKPYFHPRPFRSSPRHFKPIVPISSNGLTCSLPIKGYVTDSAAWTFGSDHGRRSR